MKVKGLQMSSLGLSPACAPDLGSAYKGYTGWFVSTVDPGLAFSMVVKDWLWDKFRYSVQGQAIDAHIQAGPLASESHRVRRAGLPVSKEKGGTSAQSARFTPVYSRP